MFQEVKFVNVNKKEFKLYYIYYIKLYYNYITFKLI